MARIPESEIERLKAEVSLERLAQGRGVVLKRHGADLLGLCPFHDSVNEQVAYLAAVSRKLERPVGVVVQSGSPLRRSNPLMARGMGE